MYCNEIMVALFIPLKDIDNYVMMKQKDVIWLSKHNTKVIKRVKAHTQKGIHYHKKTKQR